MSPKYVLLLKYLLKYKKWIFIGGIMMSLGVLLIIPTPLLTMYLVDSVLPSSNVKMLLYISLVCVLILTLKSICDNVQRYYFNKFNHKVIFDIQFDILSVFHQLSSHDRHKLHSGYLLSRINDDPNQLYGIFADTIISLIKDILMFVVGVFILYYLHWQLATATLIFLPLFIYLTRKLNRKIKILSIQLIETNALYRKKIDESISLIDTLILVNGLKYDTIKLVQAKKKYIYGDINRSLVNSIGQSVIAFIVGLAPIVVIAYGFFEIMNNRLTLGEFIAFNSFVGYIFGPTSRIMSFSVNLQNSIVSWDRIYEILSLEKENDKDKNQIKVKGKIEFRNVYFKYDEKSILHNINLKIMPLQTVAIVGESGGGKSTLMKLILSFNKCTRGSVMIDDIDIGKIANINNDIALVEQEPLLFTGTIIENITMGLRKITLKNVEDACKIAGIHNYIMSLPDTYYSLITEKGANLSIGQKQRLSIARCVVRDPKIFLMDEPTSNLDPETESNLYDSLIPFLQSRTSIIVSHRLSTIKFADEIVVLRDGKIEEKGTHHSLLKYDSYYKKLWIYQNNHTL